MIFNSHRDPQWYWDCMYFDWIRCWRYPFWWIISSFSFIFQCIPYLLTLSLIVLWHALFSCQFSICSQNNSPSMVLEHTRIYCFGFHYEKNESYSIRIIFCHLLITIPKHISHLHSYPLSSISWKVSLSSTYRWCAIFI